eukprot:Skav208078  [mRNA]  locus=scaffold1800:97442:103107:- [translate_table: standard]
MQPLLLRKDSPLLIKTPGPSAALAQAHARNVRNSRRSFRRMASPGGNGNGSGGGGGGGYNSSSTTTQVQTQQASPSTLHLVLQPRPQHNVTWAEDTVDNEHMNKKKSKKCCIFSKPRAFGESSSESEGSDDDGAARPTRPKKNTRKLGAKGGIGFAPTVPAMAVRAMRAIQAPVTMEEEMALQHESDLFHSSMRVKRE